MYNSTKCTRYFSMILSSTHILWQAWVDPRNRFSGTYCPKLRVWTPYPWITEQGGYPRGHFSLWDDFFFRQSTYLEHFSEGWLFFHNHFFVHKCFCTHLDMLNIFRPLVFVFIKWERVQIFFLHISRGTTNHHRIFAHHSWIQGWFCMGRSIPSR